MNLLLLSLLSCAAVAEGAAAIQPDVSITLNPGLQSPQMLGTSILWTASVQNAPPGHTYDYQFSVTLPPQNQIVRDFAFASSFTWVPYIVEGNYTVNVVVRDVTQQPYIVYPPVSVPYTINPWVTNSGGSAVNATKHPLVALFSAGPCTAGHSIRVRFHQNGSQVMSTTNVVPCSQSSANFYVAGMTPSTQYQMHWEEFGRGFLNSGPDLSFTTGSLPPGFPILQTSVNVPPGGHDAAFPLVLWQFIPPIGTPFVFWPTATDLAGNVLWYYPGEIFMTRMEPGGNWFTLTNPVLKEFDLAGNETLETNTRILNEQLTAKGYPVMDSFNAHETKRLPNGGIMLLGSRDVVSTQYQGGTQNNPVDIIGDMILILDHNMQLVWAWDSFAHQDLSRAATMNDMCVHNLGNGCPDFNNNFTQANDWLHTNAMELTADGNIILSERSQDWVVKVNYANGRGDGSLLWRMGPYGDFTILNPPSNPCGDPNVFPWFTHQHDAEILQSSVLRLMTVFDDGNLRKKQCGGVGNSRGMVLSVNEAQRTIFIQT